MIAGHGRLAGADLVWEQGGQIRGVPEGSVPCLVITGMTPEEQRAYVIADNQLAALAGWDEEILKLELGDLQGAAFDMKLTGFDDQALVGLLEDPLNARPLPASNYREQYGVIVICKDEADQKTVYDELNGKGREVRVVVT